MTSPTARRGRVLVGCSGFSYPDWRGDVYPQDLAQSRWLEWYADHYPTVELNNTFYRLPSRETVQSWKERVPEGFVFSIKLGAFGTHRKKLRDPLTWMAKHDEVFEPLGSSLGATIVQLPPRWKRNVARLDEFLDAVKSDQRWAVEMRDPSWLHDEVYEVLRRHGTALCIHDLLADHPRILTTDWTYVRYHGPDAINLPYRHSYGARRLAEEAAWLNKLAEAGVDSYAYFNNDIGGCAARDALQLGRVTAPPEGSPSDV